LVLDWGNGTLVNPVDGVSEVGGVEEWGSLEGFLDQVRSESVHLFHLGGGLVGELVDSNGGGSVLGVVLSNLGEGLLELGSSEVEFSSGSVGLSILSNVSDELVVFSGEDLRLEELGSSRGLVVQSNNGKGSGGSERG